MSFLPPIAVGAVGGSATRVVADLLQRAGINMGQTLNGPKDNLWFTYFFKRPKWIQHFPHATNIYAAIDLFEKATTRGLSGNITEIDRHLIQQIGKDLDANTEFPIGVGAECAEPLFASTGLPPEAQGRWGWKEPNTQIFLPELAAHIPGFRYIHVIRNGFDMAFSKNTAQAYNWGEIILKRPVQRQNLTPSLLLDYWSAVNRRTLEIGKTQLGSRFHVIHYETLCDTPETELERLFAFLEAPLPPDVGAHLIAPTSRGRSDGHVADTFSPTQIKAARDVIDLAKTLMQP